ncbi:hypothetical protein NDA11_005387 [Ustilago hordei]|uniref:Arrestin-like N-terminal domain-containing protein n=1 Tax=Ustilago hordei TaxID=120017 RepID=I2FRJ3_USTHO|nr:uncharacterized protein UHO2_05694 [Ustilago hordei]KAJ1042835.1 hypothetical protein NDA10_004075 [Ustilago hordei]KAJ1572673.1 hypothetical protein NDA15_000333 [Ustilago hordei]KAJ1575276.1 hypothetical protein NDA11_005387 [Ustilago hordei]KAJ1575688.1 hypothetical protein NDA12_002430 [Ustilago hordei]KAJ1598069.1 hypothetical protein NDA14_003552 [Ustilago hordei]
MFLTLALSDSVLVLPATDDQLHRQHNVLDAPPQYFASSLGSSASSTSLLLHPSMSTSSLERSLTAYITLEVASESSCSTLTSLTAKFVGSESLSFEGGQFEQSWPINVNVRIPVPPHFILSPGKTYKFQANLPYPTTMSPSVQLFYGRMKYKAQVKAKIRSASTLLSRSLLPAKTITAEEPLLVVQASQIEPGAFSKIKYVSAGGLGSTCISLSPSPLLLGGSTKVLLSLPDAEAKSRIQKVELSVVQDTRIRSRSGSSSSSTRTHARPYIHLQLPPAQSQQQEFDSSRTKQLERSSDASTLDNNNVLEADFSISSDTDLQPTTLPGSDAAILLSHRLILTVFYDGSDGDTSDQPKKFACSWPTTLAYPQALSRSVVDELPRYTEIDASSKTSPIL